MTNLGRPRPVAALSSPRGAVDAPPAPMWLLAVLDGLKLRIYYQSASLRAHQQAAVVAALVQAVEGLVKTVNTRILLDEVRAALVRAHVGAASAAG